MMMLVLPHALPIHIINSLGSYTILYSNKAVCLVRYTKYYNIIKSLVYVDAQQYTIIKSKRDQRAHLRVPKDRARQAARCVRNSTPVWMKRREEIRKAERNVRTVPALHFRLMSATAYHVFFNERDVKRQMRPFRFKIRTDRHTKELRRYTRSLLR